MPHANDRLLAALAALDGPGHDESEPLDWPEAADSLDEPRAVLSTTKYEHSWAPELRVRLDVRRDASGDYSAILADVGLDTSGGAELMRHWSHEDALHVGRQRAQLRLRARERARVPVL